MKNLMFGNEFPLLLSASNERSYPYGLSGVFGNQDSYLFEQYREWKNEYVTSAGAAGNLRVRRDLGEKWDTVSEGIGYGMLLAVYYDDQLVFNGLYAYYKAHVNDNGFMNWQIDADGNTIGQDGATDADEDVALALCFANQIWSNSGSIQYESEAVNLVNKIMLHEVDAETFILKPGDRFDGPSIYNPSYFAPAYYRVFKTLTGDSRWDLVIKAGYSILDKIQSLNDGTGFSPDWCTPDGQNCGRGYDMTYDAIRVPWRIGLDWSWNGNTQARDLNIKFFNFFNGLSTQSIVDGYSIKGKPNGRWWCPAFAAMIAASSMATNDIALAQKWHHITKNKQDPYSSAYHYYGSCLRILALTYLNGFMQNLYSGRRAIANPPPQLSLPINNKMAFRETAFNIDP